MRSKICARTVTAAALAAALLVGAFSGVAAAAQQVEPPGWTDPATGYVGFRIEPPNPAAVDRTSHEPVTLSRQTDLADTDLLNAFSNWDQANVDADPDLEFGWPSVFEAGGVRLERVSGWCDYTASSCQYRIASGGGDIYFFAGTVPTDANGQPEFDPEATFYTGNVQPQPLPDIHYTVNNEPTSENGKIRLTATGTYDDAGQPLTYEWKLSTANKSYTATGEVAEFSVDENTTYCVQIIVTAGDGYQKASAACIGASGGEYIFQYNGYTPPPSGGGGGNPPPSGGGGGGGGTGGGGGGFGSGIVFSRPARAPSALSGGGGTPSVIWLWRPEWYTPEAESAEPETSGTPNLRGRRDIIVRKPGREGASAGPWLAGLVAFGFGGGWFLYRRRLQMRTVTDY